MAEDLVESKRMALQFPSRFAALPDISSLQNTDNRLVPFHSGGRDRQQDSSVDDRFRSLETKITITEKSNRVLLEEVVRLQSELKTSNRRAEDALRDERNARITLENTLQANNDLISHLTLRLKRSEDKINEDLTLVSDLVSQSKSLEQSMITNRHDLTNRRDLNQAKVDELKRDIDEANRNRDQLERTTIQLKDEIRILKLKMDSEVSELSQTVKDLRGRSKKLEDENRQTTNNIRRTTQDQNQVEVSTAQLRQQVETRLGELRDVVLDIRNRHEQEVADRRTLEQQTQLRLHEMQNNVAEQIRQKEEAIHSLDTFQREKEHSNETERLKMLSKSNELAEDLEKKLQKKELKFREETQDRFIQLEKLIHEEKQDRIATGRSLESNLDQTIEGMRKRQTEDLNMMRESQKTERGNTSDAVAKLDAAITILDEQIASGQRQMDKLLAAEIKSRKQHERETRDRVDHLQEKIGVATATLQEAIGGMDVQVASLTEQVRRDLTSRLDERHSTSLRQMNDLDARLLSFSAKLAQMEDRIDGRISATSNALADNIREKVKDLSFRFDNMYRQVEEVQKVNENLPKEVSELGEKLAINREDMDVRLKAEIESRVSEVEDVRREITKLGHVDNQATMKDLDKCQATIRRLGETIQTVKTVLGMKIQHEEKIREEVDDKLLVEIDDLHILIDPNWRRGTPAWLDKNSPRPGESDDEDEKEDEPQNPATAETPPRTADKDKDDDKEKDNKDDKDKSTGTPPDEDKPAQDDKKKDDDLSGI